MSNDMQRCLQAYYAQTFPDRQGLQVSAPVNITAGWESEVYAFDVEYGPAEGRRREALVLRLYPGEFAHTKSAHEFHSVEQLHRAGYPVPRVHILEREHSPFGTPFVIMERIAGQALWPLLFRSPEGKQRELLALFCALFVQLHRLDWAPGLRCTSRSSMDAACGEHSRKR